MGKLDNTVALVTGAARGQGRSHALRLAEEGADIIALDLCGKPATTDYRGSTAEELDETRRGIEKLDRRVFTATVDVRDLAGLQEAVRAGVAELGRLDTVVANAGILSYGTLYELTEEEWNETVDINLTGVWKTLRATLPIMIEQNQGGSVVLISSVGGLIGGPNFGHYVAAKHGVTGLARSAANELAQFNIRCNSVHPTSVLTDMIDNEATYKIFRPDLESPGRDDFEEASRSSLALLPIPWVEPRDISNAVAWLASDEARYVTGIALPVDAGSIAKM